MWICTLGPLTYEVWCNKWIIAVTNKRVWYSFGHLASMVQYFQACTSHRSCSSDKQQKWELLSWQKRTVDPDTMHISLSLYHWYWILLSSCKSNTGNSSSHTHTPVNIFISILLYTDCYSVFNFKTCWNIKRKSFCTVCLISKNSVTCTGWNCWLHTLCIYIPLCVLICDLNACLLMSFACRHL